MRRVLILGALALALFTVGASAAEVTPAAAPAFLMSLASAPQVQNLGGAGIPTPALDSSCNAMQSCPAWYTSVSCTGSISCTVGTSSVTCDGTTTNCPAGTCAPIAAGCIANGSEAEWCACVLAHGNTPAARIQCTNNGLCS